LGRRAVQTAHPYVQTGFANVYVPKQVVNTKQLKNMKKVILGILLMLVLSLSFVSCEGCQDEANKAEDSMEEVGDDIEEAADDAGDAIEEAAEDVEDEIDDATDDN
jgi:hypothetical protein